MDFTVYEHDKKDCPDFLGQRRVFRQTPPRVQLEYSLTMLPLDLLGQILKGLDWTSLKNCSLVSRIFHSFVRPILFQKVALFLKPEPQVRDVRSPETSFLKFLVEDDEVASFIRKLSLEQKRSNSGGDDWQSIADNLCLLLPKLTRLEHLSVLSNFFFDWTMNLRAAMMRLCLIPQLQSLHLSFVRLQQSELFLLTAIPKLSLFCIDAAYDRPTTSAQVTAPSSRSLPSPTSIQLQDLTITAKYSDDRASVVWSILKAAGSKLTSLRIYSSPYEDFNANLGPFDALDLRMHSSLRSLAISVSLTSNDCTVKMSSLFSQICPSEASSSSKLKCIEICCDVDRHSFPSQETLNWWKWERLDAILSSRAYENLERLEITVKNVIRSRVTWNHQREYEKLEGMVVGLFRSRLPVVSKAVLIIAGPSVDKDR